MSFGFTFYFARRPPSRWCGCWSAHWAWITSSSSLQYDRALPLAEQSSNTFFVLLWMPHHQCCHVSRTMLDVFLQKERTVASGGQQRGLETSSSAKPSFRFLQLGDLKYLDFIYKRALLVAMRTGFKGERPATRTGGDQYHGTGREGFPAVRVRRVGQALMGLLATGMLSNLARRHADESGPR